MNKIEKNPNDCVIYARYSSHSQRDVSIEQQVEECEAFAKYSGLRVVKIYADRHLSGTTDQRPQFQQMLKDAERSKWSIVLTWKVDRFARNRYDSATYKYRLKRYGVKVIYAKESIPDGPEGILLEAILEGSAEYYSANLAQNVKRGLRFNADSCIANGGRMPYGYRRGADGKFEIVDSEAVIVRELFSRVAGGEKLSHIVSDFERRCVPTKYGGKWRTCTLRSMLMNEIYAGVYHFGEVKTEGGVPAIVDAAIWEEVKAHMDSVKGTRVRSESYLFSGKIRCGVCGEPMVGRTAHGRSGAAYSYYCCRGHRQKKCLKKDVKKDLLEGAVVSRVLEILNDDEVVGWIADSVVETQKHEIEKNRTAPAALKAELADVNKSINGVMAAIEAGIITPTTKGRLEELEAKAEQLKTAISDAELPVLDVDRDFVVYWLTKFRSGSLGDEEARRELVDSLVFAVRVWDDRAEAVLNYSGDERVIDVVLGGSAGAGGGSPKGYNSCSIHL
ncbi:MAG: recombinase family protein [Firmicutes bacterium]|nr:recombinase family protein [Bacillota bacterium]